MSDWFVDPLGGLESDSWDSMAGAHFYSSSFWLRLCRLEFSEVGGIWCDIPEGGIAGVPVVRATPAGHPNTRWNTWLTQHNLPLLENEGIYIGQVRGYKTDILFTDGTDSVTAARAVLQKLHAPNAPMDNKPRVAGYLTTASVDAFRTAGVSSEPVFLGLDASIHVPPAAGRRG